MPRKPHADADPEPADPQLINDPGNEDPGSLMDDARVPLLEEEAPPGDESASDS